MNQYVFALDLKNDEEMIKAYEKWHQAVWPEIIDSIKESGIVECSIYRVFNRLVLIMRCNEQFSFERKEKLDMENAKVQAWEKLMWDYQQAIPGSAAGSKWQLMEKIWAL